MVRKYFALLSLIATPALAADVSVPNMPLNPSVTDSTVLYCPNGTTDFRCTFSQVWTYLQTKLGSGLVSEAPSDGTLYGRKSAAWSHLTHNDITDWATSVPPVYSLPTASTTVLGGVKVDGTTVTISSGVISAAAGGGGTPGGTSGQIQYNNASAFGGFTASGDATINTGTGAVAVTKTGGVAFGGLATAVPGTGVATAAGVNVGTAGSFVVNGGVLGTPSSGTLTNATGLPVAGVTGLGTGVATALGVTTNAAGGVALVSTVPTAGNFVKWAAGGLVDGGAGGTSIIFPQTVSGTVNSGGIPYFSSGIVLSSSAALAANALVVGGGAGVAPSTITTGAGVNTALGIAPNTNGGLATATTTGVVVGALHTGGGSGTGMVGLADVATGSYLQSGGVTTIPAWQAFGTGAQAAVNAAINTNGGVATATTTSVVVGAINTGGGSGVAPVGLADVAAGSYLKSGGVTTIPAWQTFGAGVQTGVAAAVNSTTAGALATVVAPLTIGGTGSIATADGYYICTGACTITLPVPAAGYQFCVRNDSAITTVITIAAISTVQFEKTTYNGYGTVTTGTMVSGGALGDKICLIGRDATHYLVGSFVGTWTNS